MRRINYQTIVYVIAGLLIALGAGLFLWRNQIVDLIKQNTDLANLENSAPAAPAAAADAASSAILQNDKFRALKNNVVNFNFDKICWRPNAAAPAAASPASPAADLTTSPELTTTTVPELKIGCVLGNNNPWPAPVLKK